MRDGDDDNGEWRRATKNKNPTLKMWENRTRHLVRTGGVAFFHCYSEELAELYLPLAVESQGLNDISVTFKGGQLHPFVKIAASRTCQATFEIHSLQMR